MAGRTFTEKTFIISVLLALLLNFKVLAQSVVSLDGLLYSLSITSLESIIIVGPDYDHFTARLRNHDSYGERMFPERE